MKIKQVCEKTGLTERTVRYYIERGIISPEASEQNERNYYDFSESDIETLETVTVLKNAQFSLEEIILFLKEPSAIRKTVTAHIDKLETHSEKERETLDKLSQYRGTYFASAKELADALSDKVAKRRKYVPKINFGKDENINEKDRQKKIQEMNDRLDKEYSLGRKLVIAIIIAELVRSVIGFALQVSFANILAVCLSIGMCIGLYKGYRRVKWVWITLNGEYVLLYGADFIQFLISNNLSGLNTWEMIIAIVAISYCGLLIAISVCTTILLFSSRSVETFLNEQDLSHYV